MNVKGVPFLDFIDLLDKHGFGTIEAIQTFEVNPARWPKQQWHFAAELIQKCTGFSEQEIKKLRPAKLLKLFNDCMRKTGLVVQLTQMKAISEAQAINQDAETIWENKEH